MATYQDVARANGVVLGWAFPESSGTDFAPWVGADHLTGVGTFSYQQTGPFASAFGLDLHSGGSLRFSFAALLFPPLTTEAWIRLHTTTLGANQMLFYQGNSASNGAGLYLATNRHLHLLRGGSGDTDTGYVWPDTNWHLVDLVAPDATHALVYVDGQQVLSATIAAPIAPTPNGQGWLSDDNTYNSVIDADISYAAYYFQALDANRVYSMFLAATDPDQALFRVTASTGASGSNVLLQAILDAVRRTPTVPGQR